MPRLPRVSRWKASGSCLRRSSRCYCGPSSCGAHSTKRQPHSLHCRTRSSCTTTGGCSAGLPKGMSNATPRDLRDGRSRLHCAERAGERSVAPRCPSALASACVRLLNWQVELDAARRCCVRHVHSLSTRSCLGVLLVPNALAIPRTVNHRTPTEPNIHAY